MNKSCAQSFEEFFQHRRELIPDVVREDAEFIFLMGWEHAKTHEIVQRHGVLDEHFASAKARAEAEGNRWGLEDKT